MNSGLSLGIVSSVEKKTKLLAEHAGQIGILFLLASIAKILSALGHVRLHIPIGAKPKG